MPNFRHCILLTRFWVTMRDSAQEKTDGRGQTEGERDYVTQSKKNPHFTSSYVTKHLVSPVAH